MNLVRFQKPAYGYNALLNEMFNDSKIAKCSEGNYFKPAVNIKENDDSFNIDLVIPGYTKENVSIKNKDGVITVKADVENEKDQSAYNRQEFVVSSFERSFILPKNVDVQAIEAKYTDGILLINIPKNKIEKDKKEVNIQIQ